MAGPASGKLFGACVLERLPVVVPEDPDWELEYRAWQAVRGAAAAGSSMSATFSQATAGGGSRQQHAEAGCRQEAGSSAHRGIEVGQVNGGILILLQLQREVV